MQDYEKLGVFYLGKRYDLATKAVVDEPILYDSKDLVTHAVCVGMTGSGKTGLCISLLEEAALDGVPAIVIDPKGDMANLLLTFPQLRKEDFLPWVNAEDAARKNMSVDDFAAKQAESWKNGLASWGEDGARIARLREASEIVVYTPGSSAGIPVSILRSFDAPPPEIRVDEELLQERVTTTVTGLLGLLGIEGDPIRSREHILLSTILSEGWRSGIHLDLAGLIAQVQNPAVKKIGVMEVDAFYPAKDRFDLAMRINSLLAAPGFRLWMEGEPLDVAKFLYGPTGKPKTSIFSIAHLGDAERMFFVSLLLNQVVGWMRSQTGTTSLRAVVYIDEVFGYLPPVANPPSKLPILTLMKQARAFGVGVTLVTQNPVDLDYKALSNTGTWLIGRLQTDRDKLRILDALEGVSTGSGQRFDRAAMDRTLAGLESRVFLMHNVHEDTPVVFQSRWAMSYLRGPLTREQIRTLMDPVKRAVRPPSAVAAAPAPAPVPKAAPTSASVVRPVTPPEVPQYFMRTSGEASTAYQPKLLGIVQVRFTDAKRDVEVTRDIGRLAPLTSDPVPLNWESSAEVRLNVADLDKEPKEAVPFASLPPLATQAKTYPKWQKDLEGWAARTAVVQLWYSPTLKMFSRPDEMESDFRIRMQQASRERTDQAVDKLRGKYAPKYSALDERIRKAQASLDAREESARRQRNHAVASIGSSVLGAVMGRKGNANRTMREFEKSSQKKDKAKDAEDNLDSLLQQRKGLDEAFQKEISALNQGVGPLQEKLETVEIRPTRTNVSTKLVALVWEPVGG